MKVMDARGLGPHLVVNRAYSWPCAEKSLLVVLEWRGCMGSWKPALHGRERGKRLTCYTVSLAPPTVIFS